MLVIAVSGIGFVNYIVMQRYGSNGIAVTGFFGGLVNSTAVIGEIAGRAKNNTGITELAVGTILIADAAMAVRNLAIIVAFVPESAVSVGLPLGLIAISGVGLAYYDSDWEGDLELDFDSPFSSANALKFGVLFLAVLILTAGAQRIFGTAGFLITSFLSGIARAARDNDSRRRRRRTESPHSRGTGWLAGTPPGPPYLGLARINRHCSHRSYENRSVVPHRDRWRDVRRPGKWPNQSVSRVVPGERLYPSARVSRAMTV